MLICCHYIIYVRIVNKFDIFSCFYYRLRIHYALYTIYYYRLPDFFIDFCYGIS